jgi:large subunit ribosomal protein L22
MKAKLSQLRIAPRKVRLVADSIRGLDVEIVQAQLTNLNKKSAQAILKLLNSAIANAENNFKLKKDNLYISEIRVDEGPALKRWTPRAFGRASAIKKRTSHINLTLDEKVKTEVKEKSEKDKIKDKDIKIVKSLDEIKEIEKSGNEKNRSNQGNVNDKISKGSKIKTKKSEFHRKAI